ncbi:hypothetical protein ACTG15_07565 [Aeromonas sp. 164P]
MLAEVPFGRSGRIGPARPDRVGRCSCCYTYLTIQHDMDLITARQKNVFEVFYQRAAKILKVENVTAVSAAHLLDQPPPPDRISSDYLGYDLKSKYRFADIPLQYPAANLLNTFRYALSYRR